MLKVISVFSLLFTLLFSLHAQNGAEQIMPCHSTLTPETVTQTDKYAADAAAYTPLKQKTTIPVTAHLIRRSDGTDGVSEAELTAAIAVVNQAYTDADFEFEIVETNLIDSDDYYTLSNNQINAVSNAHHVPNTVNLYLPGSAVYGTSATCGWTKYPWSPVQSGTNHNNDYVVINKVCLNNGSTLAHEFGHYLGLYHTHEFYDSSDGGESTDGSDCLTKGDRICDTPADPMLHNQVNNDCEYTGDEIGYTPDTENIMSYSLASCRQHFSQGQLNRASYFAKQYRNYLSYDGLSADFTADKTYDNCGNPLTVTFTYTGTGATSWTWEFGDGSAPVSNGSGVISHTYTALGQYTVSLTTGDGEGNYISKMRSNYISLLPTDNAEYTDDFSNGLADWSTESPQDENGWTAIDNFLYDDNTVLVMRNYSGESPVGHRDILRSCSFDLDGWSGAKINFDVSYRYKSWTSSFHLSDTLEVAYSDDCGATYHTLYSKYGDDLVTVPGEYSQEWAPASAADWRTEEIILPPATAGKTLHFKIINRSTGANNLYLDNFVLNEINALPAELTEFTAAADEKNNVTVNWTTAVERNVDYFGIEYSADGMTWQETERITAAGNSSTEQNYTTNISLPTGAWKLRLAIHDFDGSLEYSQVRSVNMTGKTTVRAYPNPVTDVLTIENAEGKTLRLINAQGLTVRNTTTQPAEKQIIDMSDLPHGVYFLQTESDNLRIIKL